jgi:hypothetical protein
MHYGGSPLVRVPQPFLFLSFFFSNCLEKVLGDPAVWKAHVLYLDRPVAAVTANTPAQ